jgi:4-diphosphocytidyl-2-C-methyl-D-erythritol kinase
VPAKVNLFLAVRGTRPDGYHELATVFQTVSMHDLLRVGLVGPPGRGHHPASRRHMRLELWHDALPGLPSGEDNLAVRAGRLLGETVGVIQPQANGGRDAPRTVLDLSKTIPIAGGMAGGSADAAAALVALNELWGCGLSRYELRDLAEELGSDVPFLVVGGTALATGRGTRLAQVLCRGEFHWVVWPDAEPMATGSVFEAWDQHCSPSEVEPDAVLQALLTADSVALGAALHNDLEPAAFALRPRLADRKRRLLDAGALGAVLAGSGPTILGLVESAAHATALAAEIPGGVPAHSPAGGPEIIGR